MNVNTLIFHIYYCNSRRFQDPVKKHGIITRSLGHHVLVYITAGKGGSIEINQKSYPAQQGMLFYIPAGAVHTFNMDSKGMDALTVHFSYAHALFSDDEWEIENEPKPLPLRPVQQIKDAYRVDEILKNLSETWYTKQPGYEFLAKALLQQLLAAVFQSIHKQDRNYAASQKVETVIRFMHAHLGQKITMDELSGIAKLSPAYLSRIFRDATGYAPIEYFSKIKTDKAKELFIEGNKKIKEVALSLGFTDEFYFSRLFKKAEGVSPSEFCSRIVHGV